jgi:hypothetical protein
MTALATVLNNTDDDAPLRGVKAIAAHIGQSVRQTNYLLECRRLPAFKMGRAWNMRPSAYRKLIEQLEAEAMSVASKAA